MRRRGRPPITKEDSKAYVAAARLLALGNAKAAVVDALPDVSTPTLHRWCQTEKFNALVTQFKDAILAAEKKAVSENLGRNLNLFYSKLASASDLNLDVSLEIMQKTKARLQKESDPQPSLLSTLALTNLNAARAVSIALEQVFLIKGIADMLENTAIAQDVMAADITTWNQIREEIVPIVKKEVPPPPTEGWVAHDTGPPKKPLSQLLEEARGRQEATGKRQEEASAARLRSKGKRQEETPGALPPGVGEGVTTIEPCYPFTQ